MRHFVSIVMTLLMLANLAAWPSLALAEVLEHDREVVGLDAGNPPDDPAAHCQHGCAGHYGQHFQFQIAALPCQPCAAASASKVAIPEFFPRQHIPTLPFRPPLTGAILS